MIFVSSLSFVAKKAFGDKCMHASVANITKDLPIDPYTSKMDILLLGAKDMGGVSGESLREAVPKRHEKVCVIYLATNDRELKLFPDAPHSKVLRKITPDGVRDAVNEFYQEEVQASSPEMYDLHARKLDLGKNPVPAPLPESHPESELPTPVTEEEPAAEPEPEPVPEELPTLEPVPSPEPVASVPPMQPSADDIIDTVKSVTDWNILKRQISRDSIHSRLILENNEYAGLIKMLELYDVKIRDLWADRHKRSDEKMQEVRELGATRSTLQASANNIMVTKFLSILEHIVQICEDNVQERLDAITTSVATMQSQKGQYIADTIDGTEPLADKLYQYVLELVNIQAEMCNMFSFLHHEGMESIIARLGEKLPSKNEFINHAVAVSQDLYQPGNSVNLANAVIQALSSGQVSLSLLEDKVKALSELIFNVIKAQSDVIAYQQRVIDLLRANNVEEVIIRDSLLKNCFHVFVGGENIGLTATTAAYAGMLNRSHNTLVIDLSGHTHFNEYGYEVVSLDDFLEERVQQQLMFVKSDREDDPERLYQVMERAKSRINYYNSILVVLDPEQADALDQLGREALSISYITNCTRKSMAGIRSAYEIGHAIPNVAQKLITIDCPMDAMDIVSKLNMDISTTQLILIPYLRDIKEATVRGEPPHHFPDVVSTFEEAFRV